MKVLLTLIILLAAACSSETPEVPLNIKCFSGYELWDSNNNISMVCENYNVHNAGIIGYRCYLLIVNGKTYGKDFSESKVYMMASGVVHKRTCVDLMGR